MRRVYLLNDYPAKPDDNTLLGYKNASNPTEADQSGNSSFGSDTYTSLISLRNELKVESMLGIKQVSGSITMGTPVVKECQEFMKANEVRDSLTILMGPNLEALASTIGTPLPRDFSEGYVDLDEEKGSHYKS